MAARFSSPPIAMLLSAALLSVLASPLTARAVAKEVGTKIPAEVTTAPVKAQLISAMSAYVPGEPVLLALRLQPQPGWHTYWRNPGDSGQATTIEWQLPAGASATPIAWPLPSRFDDEGLVSYGYEGDTWLLAEITPPASTEGEFTVKANAKWLACREACIPGGGEFALTLKRAERATPGPMAADFAAARDRLPVTVDWPAHYTIVDKTVQIELRPPAGALPAQPALFVAQPQLVEYAKPATVTREAERLLITQPLNAYFREPPARIELVLSLGRYGYTVRATRSDLTHAPAAIDTATPGSD